MTSQEQSHTDKSLFELRQYAIEKDAEIAQLREALREFDNDENWLIESSYSNRPTKTGSSDMVYIGKWDPRVFATYALSGTPLPNTDKEHRRKLSAFYEPGKSRQYEATALYEAEKEKLRIAVDALDKAYRFMKEAKAKHYPFTTNSFVDDWIKDYEARISPASSIKSQGEG